MEKRYTYLPEGALTNLHRTPGGRSQNLGTWEEIQRENQQLTNRRMENKLLTGSLRGLENAFAQGKIIEGFCTLCDCQTMCLSVTLGEGIRGIIKREEVCYTPDGSPVKDIAILTRVGKPIQCRVLGFEQDDHGETIVRLSRREAQRTCYHEYLTHLTPGDILPARVTHMESFGAFLDIGCGMIALATVDSLSVSRIAHPKDRFSVGECIYAVVKQNDPITGRIYMSTRELFGTWEENAAAFAPAQTVTGIVRSMEEYGVFVELSPNLAGLAEPLNDSRWENCRPGSGCAVYIKSILPERMKIKLVLIDLCEVQKRPALHYYLPKETHHIDHWQYAPTLCARKIETDFTPCVVEK